MALKLTNHNIRVDTIAPATTDSEQVSLQHLLKPDQAEELLGNQSYLTKTLPSNRFGRPDDHAGVAVFFATELSFWGNGATINVDSCGLTAGGFQRIPTGQ